jgi:peptidoglycan/LPS O-acetylase OafA/YrhL
VLPSPQTDLAYAAVQALSFQHFGWFAAGAMLYVFHAQRHRGWLVAALALAIVCSLGSASTALSGSRSMAAAASILVVLFFVGSLGSPLLQRFLNLRLWQFLGFISYPLYLLHENALISMTAQLGEAWPRLAPAVLPWLPLIPLAVIFAVAWVIASRVEPALRRGLAACFKQFRTAQVPS